MDQTNISGRASQQFDLLLARGPLSLLPWLLFGLVAFLVLSYFILVSAAQGDRSAQVVILPVVIFAGCCGILFFAALVAVLVLALQERLGQLRKGRSPVAESDHSLILGWSPEIFTIISELCVANLNRVNPAIVVLANKAASEMAEAIKSRVPVSNSRILCRSGDPADVADLSLVNPYEARSILVIPASSENPDTQILKTLLALTNNKPKTGSRLHLVAELKDQRSMEAAQLIGGEEVELVLAGDFLARLAVQTCRQPGLSIVYQELLDFDGDEIYFNEEPGIVGKTFGEALSEYEDCALIGVRKADGTILINPPMVHRFGAGDKVIAIALDDRSVKLSKPGQREFDESAIHSVAPGVGGPERTLILGWNSRVPLIIQELEHYVAPASEVTVMAESTDFQEILAQQCTDLERQSVFCLYGDQTSRAALEGLDVHGYHHILVLSDHERFSHEEADARTLQTLLHLRHIANTEGHTYSIVSEMLDVRNEELVRVVRADDLVVSHRLVSLLMAQISENKELSVVFAELFRPEGSEIYLKPANEYVKIDKAVSFYTVVEAAKRKNEVAIGYRLHSLSENAGEGFGVKVNPKKSALLEFGLHDKIIVLAES